MTNRILSANLIGIDTDLVTVEIDSSFGLSHFSIVGLADKSIQEAKERVISAIRNSGLEFSPQRTVVNLAPSHLHKQGTHFDLAIAIAYLHITNQLKISKGMVMLGELGLDGSLAYCKGLVAMCMGLVGKTVTEVLVPDANIAELSGINLPIKGFSSLRNVVDYLNLSTHNYSTPPLPSPIVDDSSLITLDQIKGQSRAKRALAIAIAGRHNILFAGPPGCGKTMLANASRSLLPSLTLQESLEVSMISSISEGHFQKLNSRAQPFISPHHSATLTSLVGGGHRPQPGAISLAHKGVLFLDEIPEFSRSAINALRQPIESKQIMVSRANYKVRFPADFQLIAAMNLCPCGKKGTDYECSCSPKQINSYINNISQPIMDRFAIVIRMQPSEERSRDTSVSHETLKNWIMNLSRRDKVGTHFEAMIEQVRVSKHMSYREAEHIRRIAMTLAGLDNETPDKQHVIESMAYRDRVFT